jgi:mannose-6-phosphate isomerase-like protein (cupin superfamily)
VRVHQQVWVLEGAIDITLGSERHRLRQGDCLAMALDRPTMFHNPTRKPARYAVVMVSGVSRGVDMTSTWSIRRLHTLDAAQIDDWRTC